MGYDLLRKIVDRPSQLLIIAVLCAIISFCVLSCFAFPRSKMVPMILLMLFFATISSLSIRNSPIIRIPRFLMLCLVCISAFSVYAIGIHLNGEVHLARGLVAQSSHDLQRMSREMKKAENYFFPLDGTNTPIEWYKGMSAFYMNDPVTAKEYFLRAEKINPYHMRLLNDLGTCYEQTGDRIAALDFYKRALNLTPEFVESLLNISATYYNLKQYDSAYAYIERASQLEKSYVDLKNYQTYLNAILLARLQSIKNSVSDTSCLNSLAANPDSMVLLFQRATVERTDFLLKVRQKCR